MPTRSKRLLLDIQERLRGLENEAEIMRTVLIVKEPNTLHAAQAYDGLRKQVVAGAAERRSHLTQLAAMSVAVSRASSVEDLVPQVREWLEQAGIAEVRSVPRGAAVHDFFEDLTREGLDGPIDVVEPAYVDSQTGALLRLGRARRAPAPAPAPQPGPILQSATAPADGPSQDPGEIAMSVSANASAEPTSTPGRPEAPSVDAMPAVAAAQDAEDHKGEEGA
jgi:hypothetical protein